MKKKVFFRCDASKEVGLGHLTRCISLAFILKNDFQISFLFKSPASQSVELLNGLFQFIELKSCDLTNEVIEVKQLLSGEDILVIDGYQFTDDYFRALNDEGVKLVLVDDYGKEYPYARVVINHALGLVNNHQTSETKYCLGEKYVMLRPPFLQKAKEERVVGKVKGVFVCFGGADFYNITLKILQAFEEGKSDLTIHVVLASTFPFHKEVERFAEEAKIKCYLHYNLDAEQMASLMAECEVAVAPASSLSYEVCAIGMGFIGGYYVDNQIGIHDGLQQRESMLSMGDLRQFNSSDFMLVTNDLIANVFKIQAMVHAQRKIVDGNSDKNILAVFEAI